MRIVALLATLVATPILASGQQAAAPAAVKVQKGPYKATCQFGPADAKPISVGATVGKDLRRAATSVPKALEHAGLKVRSTVPGTWDVGVVSSWPSEPATSGLQLEQHPGVYAQLVLRTKSDSALVYGHVEAICAASPTAPDSTVQLAQRLLATRIQDALNTLK